MKNVTSYVSKSQVINRRISPLKEPGFLDTFVHLLYTSPMNLNSLVSILKKEFQIDKVPDSSINGLQVEGKKSVKKALMAVDISMKVIEHAVENGYDIIIVHHGLFWSKRYTVTGYLKKRLKLLLQHDISLFAVHLPLDINGEMSHNKYIADMLGLQRQKDFLDYKGLPMGIRGEFMGPMSPGMAADIIKDDYPCQIRIMGEERNVKSAAVISGDAGSLYEEIIASDVDLFITGELGHAQYYPYMESGKSFLFLGHYASERGGMLKLREFLDGNTEGLVTGFYEADTGL